MQFSKEQMKKASAAASAEELLAMAKADGIELTEEEAKHYYDVLHAEQPTEEQLRTLSEEELANVAGGSQCVYGKTYSSDPPYKLIVTSGNSCGLYEPRFDGAQHCCPFCRFIDDDPSWSWYCTKRTLYNDPVNLPDE